jgi:hypothetical protein
MRNYMMEKMRKQAFCPEHYDPFDKRYITDNHIAQFYGCQLVHTTKGLPLVDNCWSTCKSLYAIRMAKESMPCRAFSDMQWCMHFGDDWDKEDGDVWEDNFVNAKVDLTMDVAHHCWKFGIMEDAVNGHWKVVVIFGLWLTIDKSPMPGWYKGPIMQGPKPKPLCTSMMMHTICNTDGPLAMYKLHANTFGGKTDEDLQHCHVKVARMQKWVNLMSIILDNFKGKGHCIAIDSTYMGGIIVQ